MTRLKRIFESKMERGKDVDFADPINKRYPLDTEEHIKDAWEYIKQQDSSNKYDTKRLRKIMMNVINAWKNKIDPDGPPSI